MQPLIINAAITGMVPMKSDNPHVPITPDEIVAEAKRVRDAGATVVHVHARDTDGTPTYKKSIYGEIIGGIREECPELLISGSCSGRNFGEFWPRSEVLDVQPDFGSLTLGSLNFPKQASINAPQMIEKLGVAMRSREIVPELEIFDVGMAEYAHYLLDKGVLGRPLYANILLGSLGTARATPENACTIIRALPADTTWSLAGIGRFQFAMNSLAVVMGGHVRVGLEDAIYYDWDSRRPATNVGLIERVTRLANAAGRRIATSEEARAIIGLSRTTLALRSVA